MFDKVQEDLAWFITFGRDNMSTEIAERRMVATARLSEPVGARSGRSRLTVLVATELGAIHLLGRFASAEWARLPTSHAALESADLLDLTMALTRLVAVGLSWWCLVTTLLAIAVMGPATSLAVRRRVLALVPGTIRRHVERTLTATALAGALIGQSAALAAPVPPGLSPGGLSASPVHQVQLPVETPPPDLRPAPPGLSTTTTSPGTSSPAVSNSPTKAPSPTSTPTTPASTSTATDDLTPLAPGSPVAPGDDVAPTAAAPTPTPPDDLSPATRVPDDVWSRPAAVDWERAPIRATAQGQHVVVAGEHLWSIARDQVSVAGLATDDDTVGTYWRRVVAQNLARIPSGDPDLVVPGQVIVLPAVDGA